MHLFRKMFIYNCIQLCGNFREISIQVKRFYADFVAAHLIAVVRLNSLVCCGIQEHTGNRMRLSSELGVLIFHISENLIQIPGVKGVYIVLSLCGMCVLLGIYNQHSASFGQHDVTLHYRKHCGDAII